MCYNLLGFLKALCINFQGCWAAGAGFLGHLLRFFKARSVLRSLLPKLSVNWQ